MSPDQNTEDPARKETQEFDAGLFDEQGIHPESAQGALTQRQRNEEVEGEPADSGSWQTFKTP